MKKYDIQAQAKFWKAIDKAADAVIDGRTCWHGKEAVIKAIMEELTFKIQTEFVHLRPGIEARLPKTNPLKGVEVPTTSLKDSMRKIVNICFPNYRGRKVRVVSADRMPKQLDSYWSEGSRDYFVFYNIPDGRILELGSNHPGFEPGAPRDINFLPNGVILLQRSIFCGKEAGITIYMNQPKQLTND